MKRNIFTLLMAIFSSAVLFAQDANSIGIGTSTPDPSSVLELKSTNQGFLLPRLTSTQRDMISNPAIGLTIFNIETNCIESFTGIEWVGNCGTQKSDVKILNCDTDAVVTGTFKEGVSTNGTTLILKLDIIKKGSYTISAAPQPNNGYYYNTSGTFSSTGPVELIIPGMGSPIKEKTAQNPDKLFITINEIDSQCVKNIEIAPSAIPKNYIVNCGNVVANGVALKNTVLGSSSNIQVTLNGGTLGSTFKLSTNVVDGISFSASGILTQSPMTVTMQPGPGVPTTEGIKTLEISCDNIDGTICSVDYVVAARKMLVAGFSDYSGYGFSAEAGDTNKLLKSDYNFGTQSYSTVKTEGFDYVYKGGNESTLVNYLNANSPDIVIIGYNVHAHSTTVASALRNYLDKGGIVLYFAENSNITSLQNIFGYTGLGSASDQSTYSVIDVASDPIINGPFGNLAGLRWGDDAATSNFPVTGLPSNDIYTYSKNSDGNGITMFRHKTKSFIWCSDGGFITANSRFPGSAVRGQIVVDNNGKPMSKPYTGGTIVDNSKLFANMLAWAINQAQINGINKK